MVEDILNSVFVIIDKLKAVMDSLIDILEKDPEIEKVKSFNIDKEVKDDNTYK